MSMPELKNLYKVDGPHFVAIPAFADHDVAIQVTNKNNARQYYEHAKFNPDLPLLLVVNNDSHIAMLGVDKYKNSLVETLNRYFPFYAFMGMSPMEMVELITANGHRAVAVPQTLAGRSRR